MHDDHPIHTETTDDGFEIRLYPDPDAERPDTCDDAIGTADAPDDPLYSISDDFYGMSGDDPDPADYMTEGQALQSYFRQEYGAIDLLAHDWHGYVQGHSGTIYAYTTAAAYDPATGYTDPPAALRATAEELAAYYRGDACGYAITDPRTGEEVDACWGFYDEAYALDYARDSAAHCAAAWRKADAAARAITAATPAALYPAPVHPAE